MKKFPVEKLPHWLQALIHPDVIKEMQIKFVATAMGILVLVFIVMLTAINMIMKTVSQSQSMELLIKIAESDRYNSLNDDRPMEDIPPPDGERPPDEFMMPPPTEPETESETVALAEVQPPGIHALGWIPEDNWGEFGRGGRRDRRDDRPPDFDDDDDDDDNDDNDDEFDFDDDDFPPGYEPYPPPWMNPPETEEISETLQNYETDPPPESVLTETLPPETNPPPEVPAVADPVPPPEEPPSEPSPETVPPETTAVLPEEITETAVPPETEQASAPDETTAYTSETETSAAGTETATVTETAAVQETPPQKPEDGNNNNQNRNNNDFRMEMRPNKWKLNIILDHFALMADQDGNFLGIRNTENYDDEQAEEILAAILSTGRQKGMYGWLQYYKAEKEYGTLLVVTDKTSDQGLLNNLFRTTVIAGVLVLLVLLVFLIFFSRWITQPVKTAMDRQKQFVSDASHELKTPIAVLTANVDILQDEIGENKWLHYIQEQTVRMNQLVGDLLRLARMDNARQDYVFEEFNLSTAIEATVLPFESQAFEKQKNLEIDIQPDIMYNGSQQHIRQLAAIFIDNAMKYSSEHGTIKISLIRRGDNSVLEFYNTGCEISQEETDKIFERFYRGDKARNNKGKNGYGLGLAIAKSIMEIHKIKIQVTCEQGAWIRFLMTM